uniref:Bm7215, isoform e n=1 Tax=Brugia malayi TaxID=6279 RepID=A0A1I9G325_BRUMA|nr:Bm7215, isoform e [Brugia malayi]
MKVEDDLHFTSLLRIVHRIDHIAVFICDQLRDTIITFSLQIMYDIKRFDIYRKVPRDLTQPTTTGAIISVVCISFILFMVINDLLNFLTLEVRSELFVDDPGREGRIEVQLNISLPYLSCYYIGIDIQDDNGRHEVGFVRNTEKIPIGTSGCRFEGKFDISKTSQNLGSFNPLKNREALESDGSFTHDYVLKIVPSVYEDITGNKKYSYQYTYAHKEYVTYHYSGKVMPALWFRYELQPITIKYTERRQPFYTFITSIEYEYKFQICAVVGGTFTVAEILHFGKFKLTEVVDVARVSFSVIIMTYYSYRLLLISNFATISRLESNHFSCNGIQ